PKTRHQRPYGWENGTVESLRLAQLPSPPSKFASLPYDVKVTFNWIPPRTNPSAVEKHREVRRRSSDECLEDTVDGRQPRHEREDISPERASDRATSHPPRKHHSSQQTRHQQNHEIMKSSSVEDRLLMNRGCSDASKDVSSSATQRSRRRSRNDSDSSEGRFSRNSESESRSSIPRSSSVSVERFSMRANCDSSDFSRANSTSNERFHSDFSIAVASASSNDHVSVPTSDPFSIRNLDFVSYSRADSCERFSAPTSDRCSEERYSDLFSTRNSDFSARNSADFRTQSEEERFSDDSLEELLPPPPPISKRHSIAWEVSLEDDPLYAPGSTKVVGRRRRKSSDVSSVGSASKLRDFDDWQDPRLSTTDDDLISPYSDSSTNDLDQIRPQELTKNGTYVIRRGRKKERKVLPKTPTKTKSLSFENGEEGSRLSDVKRYSSTFDNIKSLLKEGKLEGLDEPPPEFAASVPPPDLIRVVSMPAINNDPNGRAQLEITVEEEETSDVSDKDKERDNAELPRLSSSPHDDDRTDRSRLDRSRDCNVLPTAPNLDTTGKPCPGDSQTRKKLGAAVSDERLAAKIPVNLLIEDQIVKKALKENRRQLEKVSDAIKEIENVRNSESYGEGKRWRNGDLRQNSCSKRNSFENEQPMHDRKPVTIDGSPFDGRSRCGKQQQQQQQQQYSSDSETSKASSDADFADRRKLNGVADVVYSSGRRLRQNGIESHKNDQKQIENVIDAILEDSKNPEFQCQGLMEVS
ncbi:dentin sialophospho, partial [Lasius niger]